VNTKVCALPCAPPALCRRCYPRSYNSTHSSRIKKTTAAWKLAHAAEVGEYNAAYHLRHYAAKRDVVRARSSARYAAKKVEILKKATVYVRERLRRDPVFRTTVNLRARLRAALRGRYKNGSAVSDLGCSIEDLRTWLAAKFKSGMTWENWGRRGWHIDHMRPLASFDLSDRRQLLTATHYTNLQPLWATENLAKGAS
jgi:hypothetical protein